MDRLEVHLIHGFLGVPADWQTLQEFLPHPTVCHDLLKDSDQLGETTNFQNWSALKAQQLNQSPKKKIIVGYSLGGRLALHLPPQTYEYLILVGAHPGLEKGHEVRLNKDKEWCEKLKHTTSHEWLSLWNKQDVFTKDKNRPQRNYSKDQLQEQLKLLDYFSLGYQTSQWQKLKANGSKIFWGCGSEDQKFMAIKNQLEKCITAEHVFSINDSGHGVLFDNPKGLAHLITEVANRVS